MKSGASLCAIGVVALGSLAVACSSSDDKSTTDPATTGPVTLKMTDPADGETVGPSAEYPDYPDVPIAFTVTGFTLKAPGTCAGADKCGHVHLLVDGTACNDVASKAPYNNAGAKSPINAGLDYCPKIDGEHTVTLELHNDDHSPYKVDGTVVSDSRKIVAMPESGAGGT
ncbi:MAG TPA: hypothetical protein VHE30_16120 [Polyangiaceae bacterium]|nr:hypothetical protein [Polyangiaceae bacterium]